jgi:hypothetical protein
MMPSRLRILLPALLLVAVASMRADSLESAFQARAMLGPDVWSRVLRIENDQADRHSRYPAEFHALVVAFEDILWLYTEFDGTQTLSRYAGRLEEDRADLAPLLQAVEPGLARFEDVTDAQPAAVPAAAPPYACFPAAVARWQQLRQEPNPPERARLIAYYPERQRQGHVVLEYWRDGRRYVFDSNHPGSDREISPRLAEDPLKVARSLFRPGERDRPARAMHLDLDAA